MKVYVEQKDIRFSYLKEWLSKKYQIIDNIEICDCAILDIKEKKCPKNIKNNCLIISYMPLECENNVCLSCSENYLLKNAFLTALACFHKLDLKDKKIVIYGNGRIAMFLKLLIKDSTILARHPKVDEKYINSSLYTDADLIINTIPAHLPIDVMKLKPDVKIIDLASYPFGFDHDQLKDMNIDIELWSGLPGKVFPKEAAWLIYEEVIKCLEG